MDTTKIKAKFSDSTVIKKTGSYYKKHRRFAPLISFFAGFSWDSATLTRIDCLFDNLLMLSYILLLATCILLMHLVDNEKIKNQKILEYREWYPVAMQFFFGSLFSAYVVFYFQSATLSKNWLFLLFLAALLIGNEFLKDYLSNFKLNLVLFFLATFSFFIFFVPVLIKIMNVFVFLFSGLLSLLFISGLIYTLYKNDVNPVWITYKKLGILILTVFLSINVLYFLN